MDFNEYQDKTFKTVKNPDNPKYVEYLVLGLTGEAGEIANKYKKVIRDNNGELSDEKREDLMYEIGDVLWYAAQLSATLGFKLEDVAQANYNKLISRLERGKLSGDGDKR